MTQASTEPNRHLVRLREHRDLRIARGDPDPRGWEVAGSDHRRIGWVDDLVANTTTMQVEYLDVAVETVPAGTGTGHHVLVPLDAVSVVPQGRQVLLGGMAAESIARLPAFTGLPFSQDPDQPFRDRPHDGKGARTVIEIERKRAAVWPWVLGAVLLGAVAWGLSSWMSPDEKTALGEPREAAPATAPSPKAERVPVEPETTGLPAVQSYLRFVADPPVEMGVRHEYTLEGLRRLDAALDAMTEGDAARPQQLDAFRRHVRRLEQSGHGSLEHADMTKAAFLEAVHVLESIQERRAPQSAAFRARIGSVRAQAEALRADRPLLEQEATVKRFFAEAGHALRALAGGPQAP
jgi:hypothetical protein